MRDTRQTGDAVREGKIRDSSFLFPQNLPRITPKLQQHQPFSASGLYMNSFKMILFLGHTSGPIAEQKEAHSSIHLPSVAHSLLLSSVASNVVQAILDLGPLSAGSHKIASFPSQNLKTT